MRSILVALLLTGASMAFAANWVPETMSNTDVQQSIDRLARFTAPEYQAKLKAKRENTKQANWERAHVVGDRYLVEVDFLHEQGYQPLYGGMLDYIEKGKYEPYPKDEEVKIFEHFLGANYMEYSPRLLAVAKVVALEFQVKSGEELADILSNQKVVRLKHGGDPSPGDGLDEIW